MKQNNLLLTIGIVAVLTLAVLTYVIYRQDQFLTGLDRETLTLTKQSSSDSSQEIESDINDTEFNDIDKELVDIEKELNSSN